MSERQDTKNVANQHLHLTGALNMEYLQAAAQKEAISIDVFGQPNLAAFDAPEVWALAKHLTSTAAGFEAAITHVVTTERANGVDVVELTFNPYGMLQRGMTQDDIAQVAFDTVEAAHAQGTALLLRPGVNRKDGPSSIATVHDTYRAMPAHTVLGIDLNGDERKYPTEAFVSGFGELIEQGVPVALHAGEFPDQAESMRQALRLRPERIGHAVAAAYTPGLLDALAASGSTVEVALTSNLIRGVVPSIESHPVGRFIAHDIPVIFGTDDPAFFGNTMADEFALLQKVKKGREVQV